MEAMELDTMPDVDLDEDENSVTLLLTRIPLVLEKILSFLPMKDLNRIARVCQLWSDVAKMIKRRRQHQMDWLFWMWTDRFIGKMVTPIFDVDAKYNKFNSTLENFISSSLNQVRCEPVVALTFVSVSFRENTGRPQVYPFILDCHRKLLNRMPQNCHVTTTWTNGVIGMLHNNNIEAEDMYGFSCLLLPKIPGVEIHAFDMTIVENNFHNLEYLLKKDIRALLLLSCDFGQKQNIARALNGLMQRQNHQIAIGGGFVFKLGSSTLKEENNLTMDRETMGIVFCGEKVRASSIVIKRNVTSLRELDDLMQRLKFQGSTGKRRIGFMFSERVRGRNLWKKANVEADAFSKVFPNTPLFGFFGEKEIGLNSSPETTKMVFKDGTSKVFHSGSTVIVLICIS